MRHIFVVNPASGVKNRKEEIIDLVKQELPEEEYIIYETKDVGDAIIYVKEFIETHMNENLRFYACGGDGTLNEVINGAIGYENVEVTNFPIGSANDFLKYFEGYDFKNMHDLIHGCAVKSDVIKFNERYILNVFNIGYDAKVVELQRKFKKWPLISGNFSYTLGVIFALLGKRCHKMKVTIDDELFYDGKVTMVAVANSICYGGSYHCAPLAKIDDALLDVCVVKKVSIPTFAKLAKIYQKGEHLNNEKTKDYIIYKQGSKVQIEIEKAISYSVDGELGKSNNVVLEVLNKQINFVIPCKNEELTNV